MVRKVVDLTVRVLSDRVWSSAARLATPPECYADVCSANIGGQRAAADLIWRVPDKEGR